MLAQEHGWEVVKAYVENISVGDNKGVRDALDWVRNQLKSKACSKSSTSLSLSSRCRSGGISRNRRSRSQSQSRSLRDRRFSRNSYSHNCSRNCNHTGGEGGGSSNNLGCRYIPPSDPCFNCKQPGHLARNCPGPAAK